MRDAISELEDERRDLEGVIKDFDFQSRVLGWEINTEEASSAWIRLKEVRRLIKEEVIRITDEDKNAAFMQCWEKYRKAKGLTQGFPVWEKKYRNRFDLLWEKNKLRNVADLDLFLYRD